MLVFSCYLPSLVLFRGVRTGCELFCTSVFVGSAKGPDSGFDLMENHRSPSSSIGGGFFHLRKGEVRLWGTQVCVFAMGFRCELSSCSFIWLRVLNAESVY